VAARWLHDGVRLVLVFGAVVLGELAVGLAMIGVRQWRFAPRRRTFDVAALLAAAAVLAFVYPPLALGGRVWAPGTLTASVLVALVCGTPMARRADSVISANDEAIEPIVPEPRSARRSAR